MAAGHQVVLNDSRGAETLADTVAALTPRATAATSAEAAAAGDIVVVAVPVKAFPGLPAPALAGMTVIDTCNYGPELDGHVPELDGTSLTSRELLALGRPPDASERSYLPIAGDSATAEAVVTHLIDSLGNGVVGAGPLADTWRQGTGTPVGGPLARLRRVGPAGW